MPESEFPEQDRRRCQVCGESVGHAEVDRVLDRRSGSGGSPLVRAIDDYIEKWGEADRLSLAYSERMDELRRHGFEDDPVYVCDGVYFRFHNGDLMCLREHLDAQVAAAPDPAARAAAEQKRDAELSKARQEIERWHRAMSDLGIPDLARANSIAWETVDGVDLDNLMRSEPSDMAEARALLRLVGQVGWYGCDTGDAEIPIRALNVVVRFLNKMARQP